MSEPSFPYSWLNGFTEEDAYERDGFAIVAEAIELAQEAQQYLVQGQLSAALRCARLSLTLDPNDVGALVLRGRIHTEFGEFPEALSYLDYAITLDESNWKSLIARAECLLAAEAFSEALSDYEDALESGASAITFEELHGQILSGLGEEGRASSSLTKAIRNHPTRADLYIARGRVRMKSDKWHGVRSDFRIAARLMGQDPKDNRLLREEVLRFNRIEESQRLH